MALPPKLSVVVGLISGKKSDVQRCLRALLAQSPVVPIEMLVPYDDACADVATLAAEFPGARFIRADGLDTYEARKGWSREHHDSLRTIGIRAARGELVALLEDHAHMASDWGEHMVAALERHPNAAAVGGPVDCDSPERLGWAAWFCDFGRYQSPLPERRSEFVSDSNITYRRAALERIASAWKDDYHEATVNWALAAAGFELWTTPGARVWQSRSGMRLGAALLERIVWARSFAGTRSKSLGAKRWLYALLSPALPIVMTWRLARVTRERGRCVREFRRTLPLIVLLQCAWALGECVGYVTGDPG